MGKFYEHSGGSLDLESDKPILLVFGAKWCNPCTVFMPTIKEVASHNDIIVIKVDTDIHPQLSKKFTVQAIPCTIGIMNKKEVTRKCGAVIKSDILKLVDECLNIS